MTEYIGKLRLIIAPILLVIFVVISVDLNKLSPYLISIHPIIQVAEWGIIILALGFIISSIPALIINKYNLTSICKEKSCRAEKYCRQETIKNAGSEHAEWEALGGKEFIRDQVTKRWEMAMVNFNTAFALLLYPFFLATLSSYLTSINRFFFIVPIWLFLLIIFIYNGRRAYWSNHIIVERLTHEFARQREICYD